MKHKVSEDKRMSFKGMAELLGAPYRTAHFRYRKGYSLSESLLLPVGAPRVSAQQKHGMSESIEYAAWERMHRRCRKHPHYLKLGIKVCERWASFELFYEDMGPMPPGSSLDRENGALGYSQENCRWATPKQQAQNTSRNVNLTWRGETRCVAEWAREVGLSPATIAQRVQRGWTAEQALSLPQYARVL